MSASNKGPGIDSRLQNLTNALYLNGEDDVVVRTGFAGNIVISGNVNVPGVVQVESNHENPLHCHIENEAGTSIAINDNSGSITVDGTVNIGTMPEVEIKNDSGNAIPVTGNVNITNSLPISITVVPPTVNGFYSFNNFAAHSHRGWTMDDTEIPMFAVRVKPSSGQTFRLISYDIGNNNANQSTVGYTWYNAPTITGPAWSWVEIGSSGIEYAIFSDAYSSNTPNGLTGGTLNHSGIMIGKTNSTMTPEMANAVFTDGGMTMVCAVRRLDNSTKLDVWFSVTFAK